MLRRFTTALVFGWLWVAPTIHAQEATGAAQDRAADFRAVSGAVKEDVAGGPLMLAAYAVVWVALFGYVWRLNRLQRSVEVNLERLERTVASEIAR
jgi:CcmD family protein